MSYENKFIYDEVIKNTLHTENIPLVYGNYRLGESFYIDNNDLEIFNKLFNVSPTKGYGNGELSIYWLYEYQKDKKYEVSINKKNDNPDLFINEYGVEIKSYNKKTNIPLGRIGDYTYHLNDLNTVLGINALVTEFISKGKKKTPPNIFNVSSKELIKACSHVIQLYNDRSDNSLWNTGNVFNIDFILSIFNKLDILFENHKNHDPKILGASLLRSFIYSKFSNKPGIPGFIINVNSSGFIDFINISHEKILNLSDDIVLNNISLKQGSLIFNSKIFD